MGWLIIDCIFRRRRRRWILCGIHTMQNCVTCRAHMKVESKSMIVT